MVSAAARPVFAALATLAGSMGWKLRSFEHGGNLVTVAVLEGDASFEQLLWTVDEARGFVRCVLVSRGSVRAERESAVLELCARINQGLAFGCAEYDFGERTVVYRDCAEYGGQPVPESVERLTARVLRLGNRYAPALADTIAGAAAKDAVLRAEAQ